MTIAGTKARVLSLLALAALSSGCILVHDSDDDGPHNVTPTHVDAVDIDVSEGELSRDPGAGASIIVEYVGMGRWNVNVTCDIETSGIVCPYDLYAYGRDLRVLNGDDLEDGDYIESYGDELHAVFDTDYDIDGFSFDTPLGEPVQLEVYLDDVNAQNFVFWIGNGEVWEGAPTNPTMFVPPPGL
jgi:hypothetical protein